MVFETQIPEASELVSSVTLERQILNQGKIVSQNQMVCDDAEMLTSEMHDPYTRTTGAWK